MRQFVAQQLGEVNVTKNALLWVTDFPMFEWCAPGLIVTSLFFGCSFARLTPFCIWELCASHRWGRIYSVSLLKKC